VQLFDTANNFVRCVENVFGDGILNRGLWPPRSLDLLPCDIWWSGRRSLLHNHSTLFTVRYFTLPTAAGTSLSIIAILPLVLPFLHLLQHLQVGVPHIFLSVLKCSTSTHWMLWPATFILSDVRADFRVVCLCLLRESFV